MAQERGLGILPVHAAAVIGDADEGHAAALDLHGDAGSARVDGVFHQFLHNGTGALHHFAGGDEVSHMGGKLKDFCHGGTSLQKFTWRPWRGTRSD